MNNLKTIRHQCGNMSQQQLADLVGCSRQTIISVELGCKNPSVEIALKISQALKTPVEKIFSLENDKDKDNFCRRISDFFKCSKR